MQARYDRSLAAGYKALFLCSAIANGEDRGGLRTVQSVEEWELAGIQEPLATILPTLPDARIERASAGDFGTLDTIRSVSVDYAEDAPPRAAFHKRGSGCSLLPPGMTEAPSVPATTAPSMASPYRIMPPEVPVAENELGRVGFADRYGTGTRTTAVVVLKNGAIVGEAYAQGFGVYTAQRTWSVAKSIAATIVGTAVHRGSADVHQSAGLGMGDARGSITIDHLLRMASGRYSDTAGNRTDPLYFGGSTVSETALHWPVIHSPGSVFRYANNDTLAAVAAIKDQFAAHPPVELFARLGMAHTVAETDWQGDYILSSQVWSTARDLARFGQLYLDDGKLADGTRILPEGWVRYVSTPSGPQPDGPFGYGAGFWLLDKSEGVPADTFAAMGNRGQFIIIVPSMNVVIVRRGEDPTGTRFDVAGFSRDILELLEK